MEERKKTVVVGSGLSGLCAAYFCHRAGHDVTIFEAQPQRGMDTHRLVFPRTVQNDSLNDRSKGSSQQHPTAPSTGPDIGPQDTHPPEGDLGMEGHLDVPLRVMSEDGWKTLLSLCQHLRVDTFPVDAPVTLGWLGGKTWFRSRTFKLGSQSLPMLGSLRYINLSTLKIGQNLARFYRDPLSPLDSKTDESLEDFFRHRDYDRVFSHGFLLPLLSTITTCRHEKLLAYPATPLLDMVRQMIFGPPLRRLVGGTKALVDRLTVGIPMKSGSPVVSLKRGSAASRSVSGKKTASARRHQGAQKLHPTAPVSPPDRSHGLSPEPLIVTNARGDTALADYVIFATQANHLEFLEELCPRERAILRNIEFDQGELVVHRDQTVMPSLRQDWTPLSYQMTHNYESSMFSVWVNPIEPTLSHGEPIFQTWNPLQEIDPSKILRRISLERAVVSLKTSNHLHQLSELMFQPQSRIFFCGSWAYPGVPLLESAVKSAARVALHLGVTLPMPIESSVLGHSA